ncbi:hypothetical protein CLOM_g9211 [Closterium sp. NIES-68]|nr:hypothetical protein CLOM_g9211 [Closterium sp. NIES-68]GJP61425.1 hypothetical protein CLOP_g18591 [Closterium sp. NIES-67]
MGSGMATAETASDRQSPHFLSSLVSPFAIRNQTLSESGIVSSRNSPSLAQNSLRTRRLLPKSHSTSSQPTSSLASAAEPLVVSQPSRWAQSISAFHGGCSRLSAPETSPVLQSSRGIGSCDGHGGGRGESAMESHPEQLSPGFVAREASATAATDARDACDSRATRRRCTSSRGAVVLAHESRQPPPPPRRRHHHCRSVSLTDVMIAEERDSREREREGLLAMSSSSPDALRALRNSKGGKLKRGTTFPDLNPQPSVPAAAAAAAVAVTVAATAAPEFGASTSQYSEAAVRDRSDFFSPQCCPEDDASDASLSESFSSSAFGKYAALMNSSNTPVSITFRRFPSYRGRSSLDNGSMTSTTSVATVASVASSFLPGSAGDGSRSFFSPSHTRESIRADHDLRLSRMNSDTCAKFAAAGEFILEGYARGTAATATRNLDSDIREVAEIAVATGEAWGEALGEAGGENGGEARGEARGGATGRAAGGAAGGGAACLFSENRWSTPGEGRVAEPLGENSGAAAARLSRQAESMKARRAAYDYFFHNPPAQPVDSSLELPVDPSKSRAVLPAWDSFNPLFSAEWRLHAGDASGGGGGADCAARFGGEGYNWDGYHKESYRGEGDESSGFGVFSSRKGRGSPSFFSPPRPSSAAGLTGRQGSFFSPPRAFHMTGRQGCVFSPPRPSTATGLTGRQDSNSSSSVVSPPCGESNSQGQRQQPQQQQQQQQQGEGEGQGEGQDEGQGEGQGKGEGKEREGDTPANELQQPQQVHQHSDFPQKLIPNCLYSFEAPQPGPTFPDMMPPDHCMTATSEAASEAAPKATSGPATEAAYGAAVCVYEPAHRISPEPETAAVPMPVQPGSKLAVAAAAAAASACAAGAAGAVGAAASDSHPQARVRVQSCSAVASFPAQSFFSAGGAACGTAVAAAGAAAPATGAAGGAATPDGRPQGRICVQSCSAIASFPAQSFFSAGSTPISGLIPLSSSCASDGAVAMGDGSNTSHSSSARSGNGSRSGTGSGSNRNSKRRGTGTKSSTPRDVLFYGISPSSSSNIHSSSSSRRNSSSSNCSSGSKENGKSPSRLPAATSGRAHAYCSGCSPRDVVKRLWKGGAWGEQEVGQHRAVEKGEEKREMEMRGNILVIGGMEGEEGRQGVSWHGATDAQEAIAGGLRNGKPGHRSKKWMWFKKK